MNDVQKQEIIELLNRLSDAAPAQDGKLWLEVSDDEAVRAERLAKSLIEL
jgi:hypothetical protein